MTGQELAFGLRPVNGSNVGGVAVLRADGDRTVVTAYVTAIPAAGGAPAGGAGPATAVEIKDFAFGPATVEVAAGATVTWTNRDGAPHSVAFDDIALADSPLLAQGESFSQTFDEPGTYAYHCGPHPNMHGIVVVK